MRTTAAAFLAAFFVLAATSPIFPPTLADPSSWRAEEVPYLALQAQTVPTGITIPWGDWLSSFLGGLQQALATLLLAASAAVVTMLPSWVQTIVRPLVMTWRTNQLFEKAAATAIAGVKGATSGKRVEIPVANELVRTLLQLVVERGAPAVLDFAGRTAREMAEKALARLQEQDIVLPEEYTLNQATQQAHQVLAANPGKTA